MPPKTAKKKEIAKDRKKDEQVLKISRDLKEVLSRYEEKCKLDKSPPHVELKKYIKTCADSGRICSKLILDTPQTVEKLQVKLAPLIATIRSVRYQFVKEIYVWNISVKYEDVAALGNFLEQPTYSINYLDLLDCNIDGLSIDRLSRSLSTCSLTTILLDYNKIGDEGCKMLCCGLQDNTTLVKLSLCYCDLRVLSGMYLGKLISESAISELYINGNKLECEGLIELIKLIVDKAEQEAITQNETSKTDESNFANATSLLDVKTSMSKLRVESASPTKDTEVTRPLKLSARSTSGRRKRKRGSATKKHNSLSPPKVGPWLAKLHVVDNGIDAFGIASKYAPVICMRLIKKWIANSKDLKELDIDDNLIGDLGAREIFEGLQQRKQNGNSPLKIWVTHRINSETFTKIMQLGSGGVRKRKKRKKGKPGKKRI